MQVLVGINTGNDPGLICFLILGHAGLRSQMILLPQGSSVAWTRQ
jgi:hypothetical protein